jgi:hypothetical protein
MELEKKSDVDRNYHGSLESLNNHLYKLLNDSDTFNEQINTNIDKNDDFIKVIMNYINGIITKNKIRKVNAGTNFD